MRFCFSFIHGLTLFSLPDYCGWLLPFDFIKVGLDFNDVMEYFFVTRISCWIVVVDNICSERKVELLRSLHVSTLVSAGEPWGALILC